MTTSKELNASFDSLSKAVLQCKAERDELLEACKAALQFSGSMDAQEWDDTKAYIIAAIAKAEGH